MSRVVFFYSNIQSKTGLDELSRIGFSSFKKFGETVGVFAFSQVTGIGWSHLHNKSSYHTDHCFSINARVSTSFSSPKYWKIFEAS